jgi:sacsin
MVPKPIGDNKQKQPLTVALRNITREYSAGPGVLKELLQNADDAGASTVVSSLLHLAVLREVVY